MKVLTVHNRYRADSPSGENQLVAAEADLLREHGVEVTEMVDSSDRIAGGGLLTKAGLPARPIHSFSSVSRMRTLLREQRPDVVHVHNVFPLISPSVVGVAVEAGVPVVHTVHNFRHSCVNGLHFRDGGTCTDCLGRAVPWPAVRHGCYRDSHVQSIPMAAAQVVHRRTWNRVGRMLALTDFMADRLVTSGVPRDLISVRPTWVPDLGPSARVGRDLVYVGRLDVSKGIELLLQAWDLVSGSTDRRLIVVGDGPARDQVERSAHRDPSIDYRGRLSSDDVARTLGSAGALVLPSLCFEGFPLTIAEAFSRSRGVVTVAGGSAETIVTGGTGWVSAPTPEALAATLGAVTDDEMAQRGRQARTRYESTHSPAAGVASLVRVYEVLLHG